MRSSRYKKRTRDYYPWEGLFYTPPQGFYVLWSVSPSYPSMLPPRYTPVISSFFIPFYHCFPVSSPERALLIENPLPTSELHARLSIPLP
jgi:hypothetical protein